MSLPRLKSSRSTCRFHDEIQPWKTYEHYVRDQFHAPNRAIRRTLSCMDIGPTILLQHVYEPDLTASFGGKVQLRDEYTIKKRIVNSAGYLDRAYVDARADIYPTSRFRDIQEPDFHHVATDAHLHMYRPWKVHLPPTYPTTWRIRYENTVKGNFSRSAALLAARRKDPFSYILSGGYGSPTYWNSRFGEGRMPVPYLKNPWYLNTLHYTPQ